jgi:hypothetical protein
VFARSHLPFELNPQFFTLESDAELSGDGESAASLWLDLLRGHSSGQYVFMMYAQNLLHFFFFGTNFFLM